MFYQNRSIVTFLPAPDAELRKKSAIDLLRFIIAIGAGTFHCLLCLTTEGRTTHYLYSHELFTEPPPFTTVVTRQAFSRGIAALVKRNSLTCSLVLLPTEKKSTLKGSWILSPEEVKVTQGSVLAERHQGKKGWKRPFPLMKFFSLDRAASLPESGEEKSFKSL